MTRFGIGQPVRRVEDRRFLTGGGRYVDDFNLPHQCHAVVVMSPHAHARIGRVDATQARLMPGVVCVLTGADAIADELGGFPPLFLPAERGGPPAYRTLRPILVADRVRYVGDRVAMVVAETLVQARDAAERIDIDYEPLPAVVGLEEAVAPGAPLVWEDCPSNQSFEITRGDAAATDAVIKAAPHVVSIRLVNNRLAPCPIEPRATLGQYDSADDSFTLHTTSQNPHGVRTILAAAIFRRPETSIRVIAPDVGGGFGLKSNPHPEDALVLWAARRCGRPVKWTATRSDALVGDNQARDQIVHGEMALDTDGTVLAIRMEALQALGSYFSAAVASTIEFSVNLVPNVYRVPAVSLRTRGVFTHTSPTASYRGAGRPEAIYLTERLLDRAASVIGIDPVEIRRRNLIPARSMPYLTPTGFQYDSGEFERVLDACLRASDWNGFAARHAASERVGKRRGRAVVPYIEQGGRFNDRMELRFDPSGMVTIVAGTHSHGQGHATTYAQMVTDWLGVPFAAIRFVQGDTDQVPFGRGSFAARASLVGGCALRMAADAIIDKARPMAAHLMEAAVADLEFKDGRFRIKGTDRSLPLTDVAKAFYRPAGMPRELGTGLDASGSWAAEPPNFPNGCHICELEVDCETGSVTIDRYTVVDDVGIVINPLICEGQVHGGLAQGIGQALMEAVVYEHDSGQLLSGSLTDYCLPRADDFPSFTLGFEVVPCTTNPLGIKGIGEAGAVGSPPAVINAIIDALRPLGVVHIDMPATPRRVWEAIELARVKRQWEGDNGTD